MSSSTTRRSRRAGRRFKARCGSRAIKAGWRFRARSTARICLCLRRLGASSRSPPPTAAGAGRTFLAAPPRDFDLDLRLSAERLDVYGVGLDDVAVSALLRDGALTASLIDATAYGGHAKGELRIVCDDDASRVEARGSVAGADFGAAATDLGWPDLTGKGAAEFAIKTAGRSPAELIAGLSGDASFSLEDGAISGINLEEALRRGQRRPIDVTKDMRSGGTAFDQATVSLLIGGGVAHVLNGALVARGLSADFQGAVDLVGQSWKLRINAAQAAPAGAAPPDAPHLSLDVSGPWSNSVHPGGRRDGQREPWRRRVGAVTIAGSVAPHSRFAPPATVAPPRQCAPFDTIPWRKQKKAGTNIPAISTET